MGGQTTVKAGRSALAEDSAGDAKIPQKEFLYEWLNAWSQFEKPPSSESLCLSQLSHFIPSRHEEEQHLSREYASPVPTIETET